MRTIKKIAKRLKEPGVDSMTKTVFRDLIAALEAHEKIEISRIFALRYTDFELAIQLLVDWRLYQHTEPSEPGSLLRLIEDKRLENIHLH